MHIFTATTIIKWTYRGTTIELYPMFRKVIPQDEYDGYEGNAVLEPIFLRMVRRMEAKRKETHTKARR